LPLVVIAALRRRRRDARPAFTLLELIVVLLVLGVLAAITVPTYAAVKLNTAERSMRSAAESVARNASAIALAGGEDPDPSHVTQAASEVQGLTEASGVITRTIGSFQCRATIALNSSGVGFEVSGPVTCDPAGDPAGQSGETLPLLTFAYAQATSSPFVHDATHDAASGATYVVGHFSGSSATFAGASTGSTLSASEGNDAFVARLDADGTWAWAVSFGGTGSHRIDTVAVINSAVYVSVQTSAGGSLSVGAETFSAGANAEHTVIRLSPSSGAVVWAANLDAGADGYSYVGEFFPVDAGTVGFVGSIGGTVTAGAVSTTATSGWDMMAGHVSGSGEVTALVSLNTSTENGFLYGAVVSGPYVYAVGSAGTGTIGKGAGSSFTSAGGTDGVLVTLVASTLDVVGHSAVLASAANDDLYDVHLHGGDLYVAGDIRGAATVGSTSIADNNGAERVAVVARVLLSGGVLWGTSPAFPTGSALTTGASVTVSGDGVVFVTGAAGSASSVLYGSTERSSAGSNDAYLAALDLSGTLLASQLVGSTGNDAGRAVAVASSGDVLWATYITGEVSFGDSTQGVAGQGSSVVTRLSPSLDWR